MKGVVLYQAEINTVDVLIFGNPKSLVDGTFVYFYADVDTGVSKELAVYKAVDYQVVAGRFVGKVVSNFGYLILPPLLLIMSMLGALAISNALFSFVG
jgi:hypothetical protein